MSGGNGDNLTPLLRLINKLPSRILSRSAVQMLVTTWITMIISAKLPSQDFRGKLTANSR
jgi:hypothetical protein